MQNISQFTSDEELMELYLQADITAFETLYKRHSGRIFSYLRKKVEPEVAEELLQDVFSKMHTAKHTYNNSCLFLPWIFTITRNTLLDYFKKAETKVKTKSDSLSLDSYDSPSPAEENNFDFDVLIKNLSPEQKIIFNYRYQKDWSFEQIANQVGKSQLNVRQIISRSIKKIKQELYQSEGDL